MKYQLNSAVGVQDAFPESLLQPALLRFPRAIWAGNGPSAMAKVNSHSTAWDSTATPGAASKAGQH